MPFIPVTTTASDWECLFLFDFFLSPSIADIFLTKLASSCHTGCFSLSWLLASCAGETHCLSSRMAKDQMPREPERFRHLLASYAFSFCAVFYLTEASPDVAMSSAPALLKIVLARSVSSEFSECTDIRMLPSFTLLS
jgi:hypothetical protein